MAPLGRCPGRWLLYRPDSKARRLLLLAGYECRVGENGADLFVGRGEASRPDGRQGPTYARRDARKEGGRARGHDRPLAQTTRSHCPGKIQDLYETFHANLLSRYSFSFLRHSNSLSSDRYDLFPQQGINYSMGMFGYIVPSISTRIFLTRGWITFKETRRELRRGCLSDRFRIGGLEKGFSCMGQLEARSRP